MTHNKTLLSFYIRGIILTCYKAPLYADCTVLPNYGALWGIFGSKWDEVRVEWRKLHNEELNDVYCSSNIVWLIKSRRMRWAEHVECMGRREMYTEFW